jgi:hypothetical protein
MDQGQHHERGRIEVRVAAEENGDGDGGGLPAEADGGGVGDGGGKEVRLWQLTRIGTVARTQRRFFGTAYGGAAEMQRDGCRTQSSCFGER